MTASDFDETHAAMPTSRILSDPRYLRDVGAMRRSNPWVSTMSRFNETTWRLDRDPPCQVPVSTFEWRDIPTRLAADLKLLVLRNGAAGPHGSGQSVASVCIHAYGAIPLGRWMATERLRCLADLGAGGGDDYLKALAEKVREIEALDPGEPAEGWDPRQSQGHLRGRGSLTFGKAGSLATFLLSARTHGAELEALGIRALDDPPFIVTSIGARSTVAKGTTRRGRRFDGDGVTVSSVAAGYGILRRQVKERIPDAVRFPMLDAFERLLGAPADDCLRLLGRLAALMATGRTEAEATAILEGSTFSVLEGEGTPWRESFTSTGGKSALRRLVHDIVAPASAVVLDATGMRPGEFVMLGAGRRPRTSIETRRSVDLRYLNALAPGTSAVSAMVVGSSSLPTCVSETLSVSGLTIMVYLHGRVFKQKKRPVGAYWLLGSRQDEGSDPIALRALDVLERLSTILQPFADEGDHGRLLLQVASGPDEPMKCSGLMIGRLQGIVTYAIRRHVDLTGIGTSEDIYDLRRYSDSRGGCINLYQFRRTYVQLAYRTEPRLLVPLARQLHHTDSSVTKRAYVTSDPTLIRELEQAHSRETVAMFRAAVEGRRRLGGNMGNLIERFGDAVRERILALPEGERDDAVARAFHVDEFRMHFLNDVTCMIGLRPAAALCNRMSGRAGFKVDEPDLSLRDGTMCAACANGCFDRDRHGPAILRRYLNNRTTYLRHRLAGRGHLYGAWRLRAERDEALLTRLGVPFPTEKEIIYGIG